MAEQKSRLPVWASINRKMAEIGAFLATRAADELDPKHPWRRLWNHDLTVLPELVGRDHYLREPLVSEALIELRMRARASGLQGKEAMGLLRRTLTALAGSSSRGRAYDRDVAAMYSALVETGRRVRREFQPNAYTPPLVAVWESPLLEGILPADERRRICETLHQYTPAGGLPRVLTLTKGGHELKLPLRWNLEWRVLGWDPEANARVRKAGGPVRVLLRTVEPVSGPEDPKLENWTDQEHTVRVTFLVDVEHAWALFRSDIRNSSQLRVLPAAWARGVTAAFFSIRPSTVQNLVTAANHQKRHVKRATKRARFS